MQVLRPGRERGYADHGWLKSFHSFSFAGYHDPEHVNFGPLRVLNEDRIDPGTGFGTHGHRDMEILSYVLDGALAHRDSLGTGSTIVPGDVQRLSAGTGVQHSEFNPDGSRPTHFLQIWIIPEKAGLAPGYEQKHFPAVDKRGRLRLIASRDGADGSVRVAQDAKVYAGLFDVDETATFELAPGRRAYVHLARGALTVGGTRLAAGDALRINDLRGVRLEAGDDAEVLLFDLPGEKQ